MNRRQRDKALAHLALQLSTQIAAKDTANAQGNEAHFYTMCSAVEATQAEIWALQSPGRRSDTVTAALISANVD